MQKKIKYTDILRQKFLLIVLSLFSVMILSLCMEDTINYDEFFSLLWCRLGWRELMQRLINDVHPPLYYLILKPIFDLTNESMFCSRLLSAITGILILWTGGLFIEKYFGKKSALFFVIFTYLNPFMIQKTTEVRMYMLASIFTIMSGIMSYFVLRDSRKKNWSLFVLFSLLAAYTHYYALLTMVFLYIGILVYFIFTHNRKEIIAWLFYSLITVIGYLPWLPFAWKQFTSVNQGYWITAPSSRLGPLRELFSYYKFPYAEHIYMAVLILLTVTAMIRFCVKRNPETYWTLICCSALWGILFFSIWYASHIRPLLVSRYLIMALCLFILGISGTVSCLNKYYVTALCLFCTFVGSVVFKDALLSQANHTTTQTIAFADEHFSENDCILYFDNNDQGYFTHCLTYYFPQADCILIEESQLTSIQDTLTEPYENIWFFDHSNYLDNGKDDAVYFEMKDWGTYGFKKNTFEIYKIDFDSIDKDH